MLLEALVSVGVLAASAWYFGESFSGPYILSGIDSVLIIACGTSSHAGLVARHWIEGLALAKMRGKLAAGREAELLDALRSLPSALTRARDTEGPITDWSLAFSMRKRALFLGRGIHYPIAMEGALKLKEITYIHAVPLQLLAYHAAICRGTDVDKPRNLAKSVTVE